MNSLTEFAQIIKERDNPQTDFLFIGKIVSLPDIKISINNGVILSGGNIRTTVDLMVQDENGEYIYTDKEVIILSQNGRFYVTGVLK